MIIGLPDLGICQFHDDCDYICGWYEYVDSTFMAIYKQLDTLYLLVGSSIMRLDEVQTRLEKNGQTLYLQITSKDYQRTMEQPFTDLIENDPTPFVELDHFNFLLFLHNIINSQLKQEVALKVWHGCYYPKS